MILLHVSSSTLGFLSRTECKASLLTDLLEIDCTGGKLIVSGIFNNFDSISDISHKCYKAVRIIERISTLIIENAGISSDLYCENRKTVQKMDWKDVLKWISDSPIRVLDWASIEVPKIIIE